MCDEGYFGRIPVLFLQGVQVNLLAAEDIRKSYDMYAFEGWGTRVVQPSTGETLDFVMQ